MFPTCPFCDELVDPHVDGSFWEISGWSPFRVNGGGFNSISLRTPSERFAHGACIQREVRRQQAPETDTLF